MTKLTTCGYRSGIKNGGYNENNKKRKRNKLRLGFHHSNADYFFWTWGFLALYRRLIPEPTHDQFGYTLHPRLHQHLALPT